MGASGAIIMGFFGAVFATMTLALPMHLGGWIVALPFLVFVAIAAFAVQTLRLPGPGLVRTSHAARVIMWSTIGEGIGLFIAANLVVNLGHPDLLIPAVAVVVGLHFLPMAWGIPFPAFYLTGVALIIAGAVGIVVSQPAGDEGTGFAAAATLMASAIAAIQRDRRLRLT